METKTNDQKVLNIFEGSNTVLDFLNPDNAPYTPLVEIPDHLNPYRNNGVRIFAKLMNALPLANVKSLPAYNMLLNQKEKGSLPDTLIENSSGNTVFSLAIIARLMGIPHTKAIVSHEVSRGKLNILRFLGTEVIVNKFSEPGGIGEQLQKILLDAAETKDNWVILFVHVIFSIFGKLNNYFKHKNRHTIGG